MKVLLPWLCFAPVMAGEVGFVGPMATSIRNPLFTRFAAPSLCVPEVPAGQRLLLSYRPVVGNLFERGNSDRYLLDLDMEFATHEVEARWRLSDRWELGLLTAFQGQWGGDLDGAINGFHTALGLPDDDRHLVENGRFSYRLDDLNGLNGEGDVVFGKTSNALMDPVASLTRVFSGVWDQRLSLFTELAVGDSRVSEPGTDFGLTYAVARDWVRWRCVGAVAVSRTHANGPLNAIVRHGWGRGTLAVERLMARRWSLLAQLDGASSLFRDTGISDLDDVPLSLALGVGFGTRGWRFRASFSEDLVTQGPAIDIAAQLEIARAF